MTTTPILCAKCSRPVRSYFRIERIDQDGNTTVTAVTCSIICLVQWCTNYATMLGTMGAMKAKSTLDQVVDFVRGIVPKK